jgi:hypothetical protein
MSLPTFSGKYYASGGAYERPQTVLDKSGFIKAQTISQLGNMITSATNRIFDKKNREALNQQRILDENYKYRQQNVDSVLNNLRKAGVNNKSLYEMGMDLMNKRSDLDLKIKGESDLNKRKELIEEQNKNSVQLGDFYGVVQGLRDASQQYVIDYIENASTVNQQGGAATVGSPYYKTYMNAMDALTGSVKNPEANFYHDNEGNIRVRATSDQIKKEFETGEIDTSAFELFNSDPGKIANIRLQLLNHLRSSGVINKNGEITDAYVNKDKSSYIYNDDNTLRYMATPTNIELIKTASQNAINAMIKSYLNDPDEAQKIYQNIFQDNDRLEVGSGGQFGLFTPESEAKFTNEFNNYFLDLIPEIARSGKPETVKPIAATTKTGKQKPASFALEYYQQIDEDPAGRFTAATGREALYDNVKNIFTVEPGTDAEEILDFNDPNIKESVYARIFEQSANLGNNATDNAIKREFQKLFGTFQEEERQRQVDVEKFLEGRTAPVGRR